MATNILKCDGPFYGSGEPNTNDQLVNEVSMYPIGSVYIDSATGAVYLRTAANKVRADWVSETAYAGSLPTLGTPSIFTAAPATGADTKVDISWTGVSGASGYVLQIDDNAGFSSPTQIYAGANTNYQATGLTAATQYWFRVKATATGWTDSAWASDDITTAA